MNNRNLVGKFELPVILVLMWSLYKISIVSGFRFVFGSGNGEPDLSPDAGNVSDKLMKYMSMGYFWGNVG